MNIKSYLSTALQAPNKRRMSAVSGLVGPRMARVWGEPTEFTSGGLGGFVKAR